MAGDAPGAEVRELRGRLPPGIGLGGVAASAEGRGLDGERPLEERVGERAAMLRGAPLARDVGVAPFAGGVPRRRVPRAKGRPGPGTAWERGWRRRRLGRPGPADNTGDRFV